MGVVYLAYCGSWQLSLHVPCFCAFYIFNTTPNPTSSSFFQNVFVLVYIRITCSIWYFIQFVHIAIFMSLHAPAGACILVASVSPIHVFPIHSKGRLLERGMPIHVSIVLSLQD